MNRFQFPGALALCISATLVAQKPVDAAIKADGTVKIADASNRAAPPPVATISESVALSQKAPDGTPVWQECHDSWYGVHPIKGKKVLIVVGKSKVDSETPDLIGIDLNGDGKLVKDEQLAIEVAVQPGRDNGPSSQRSTKPVDAAFAIDNVKIPIKVSYGRGGDNPPSVGIAFPSYLEATVKIGDKERIVAVLDKDLDGKFGSAGDMWALAEVGAKQPVSVYLLNTMTEKRFDVGNLIGLNVTGNSVGLATTAAKGPDAATQAAMRERAEHIWTKRFDADRDSFAKRQQLDLARPKATTPIKWNYVSFDEAVAMAKKANKPLFIDVMAFWCVWCYRMDDTTYPDKQVADLLNNSFVPVKIIQEQATGDDYKNVHALLKAKNEKMGGIPAMGVFDTQGNCVHTISGWNKAEEFVKQLETGLEASGAKK
ncbi:MAG TPA: DUF255 domain-containing protein [Planctomycetota bacterium]|nr:DUF255 domain-containing protein [Planctomycetota bacterium]